MKKSNNKNSIMIYDGFFISSVRSFSLLLSSSLSLSPGVFFFSHDSLRIRFYVVALYLYNTFWHWLLCKTLFKKRSFLNVIRKIVSEWHSKFVILNECHKNAYFGLCLRWQTLSAWPTNTTHHKTNKPGF